MTEIRLNRAVSFTDTKRDMLYIGPGAFAFDGEDGEEIANEYLSEAVWEPADAFDAEAFLDRPATEIMADWGHINGHPTADYDDKLDELRETEHANRQRRDVLDMIRERAQNKEPNAGTARKRV